MAETNSRGAFWGFEVRRRQLADAWPVTAYAIPLEARIWSSGGYRSSSTGRITVSSDTATAVARGTMPTVINGQQYGAASGTSDYGWYTGGDGPGSNARFDVYRITYAADTVEASLRGPMIQNRKMHTSTTDGTYGWQQSGGTNNGSPNTSSTERITFVSDTATGVARGPMIASYIGAQATGNSTNGWVSGGYFFPAQKIVQRVTYATDTAVAVNRASVTITNDHRYGGATGNADQGWFSGQDPAGSAIIRITYATDTATPVARGPLAAVSYRQGVSGNSTDGWWIAGKAFNGSPAHRSTVQRVNFATDTATASIRGPLHVSTGANQATSGTA